ncbi:sialidase family protein [Bremerella alba]|uniref:Sialidase n=1 Tax=Bremerella alba TaxID=980252 RepID=A0A7V8V2Q3_9BACT|nr:sialidase family protein [Bremerella alba]MBA2113833.1 hypothetical protein [Bremerella alba]
MLPSISRRHFLAGTCAATFAGTAWAQRDAQPLIQSIEHETIWENRDGKSINWFHPRACVVDRQSASPLILMTTQEITGSDFFGPVHWSATEDLGETWSTPELIPAFDLRPVPGHDGLKIGVCDVVPEYHPPTNTTLAVGHCVYYRGNHFSGGDQLARYPMYSVRDSDGNWSDRKKLVWDDPRGSFIYSNNCGQRVVLPDGDVLMSFTFGDQGKHRLVAGVRCGFDGENLVIKQVGDPLVNNVGRGLLEPSVAQHQGRYFITIRAEDNRGYVAVSDDGLKWSAKKAWSWDNGEPLTMSTTQQHWLTHSDGLFLVYTRKDKPNQSVFRWRAPLYVCQVDPESLQLIRETEQIALPLVGDGINDPKRVPRMGNFHVVNASLGESWVTVGEAGYMGSMKRGDTLMARLKWSQPNRLVAS